MNVMKSVARIALLIPVNRAVRVSSAKRKRQKMNTDNEPESLEQCQCGKAPECLPGRHYRQVACRRCGRRGPLAPDEDLAIKLWNNDRCFVSSLGYEHAITVGWDEHNARRHWLIEAKRSRLLSESEIAELAELQWLAGMKRELQTGPKLNASS